MRILIFNWRDIKNPFSGGAEILTHEIAKYLVKRNNEVVLFTSRFEGSKAEEILDGVKIVRKGHTIVRYIPHSVHFLAFKEYRKHFKGRIDLIIDEVHGFPFFTPLYAKEKKVALVCEVAGGLWFKLFGPFLGSAGWLVEKFYLRIIYRNIPFITISKSAKESLIKNGVNKNNIEIIPVGFSLPKQIIKEPKIKKPTLIFLGRVAKSKGIEDVVYVLEKLKHILDIQLWIIGKGEKNYVKSLKKLINEFNLTDKVVFYDYVSEKQKFKLLSRAWVLVHPSKTEGWGINVIESNSVGTPAVGYNVPGLRDSIQNNKTGLLTNKNCCDDLAKATALLIEDKPMYNKLSKQAIIWSRQFEWQKAGEKIWNVIKEQYDK
ncbi:MAG: glycosyltransferase family 1 protein [Gammaproteobacteria bacterium]|nr:MAG: glycosyltransferase family 1 protein [Gammaproteobacteria bacterium]